MSVGRLLAATIGLLLALAVLGIGLALSANNQLNDDRRFLLDEVGPARRAALDLENALINEETGVRGYLITGEPSFLAPYTDGRTDEEQAYTEVRVRERAIGSEATADAQAGCGSDGQAAVRCRAGVLARVQTTLTRKDAVTRAQLNSSLDERADEYIEFAVDGAKRMQVMINDLLAFSRVGRGGREDELLELDEVLAAAQSALAEPLRDGGASVIAEELPAVRGDRTQLISLFQNLLGNAVKFRGEQAPVVRIAAERASAAEDRSAGKNEGTGEEWRLSFADNGIGIEAEYAERIFLIFQRLHSRDAYAGSGIGLALCRKIVEYHGGRIWLDTEYSNGACFTMTLPIAKESGQ